MIRLGKYNARKTVVGDITFDSAKEARRWADLNLMVKAGEITDLKRQVRYPCIVNGKLVCAYFADFAYRDSDGVEVVEDVKGFKTDIYRLKKKLVAAVHSIDIREV